MFAVFDDTTEHLPEHADAWVRSADYGESFTAQGHMPDPRPGEVSDTYGSPCAAFDGLTGTLYVAALGSSPRGGNALALFASADDGMRFGPALDAADPNVGAGDFLDFPSIAVDSFPGEGQDGVYLAYADFVSGGQSAVRLRLSTLRGRSFAVTEVVNPPLGSREEASMPSIGVTPRHDVVIAFYEKEAGGSAIAVVVSSDRGSHFGAPVRVAELHPASPAARQGGNLGLTGEGPDGSDAPFDAYPSPTLVVNPVSGALYVAYVDAAGDDRADVFFTQSGDVGRSWTAPIRVNDDTSRADQFLPAMAVTPDGRHLAIAFYDRRDDPGNRKAARYASTGGVSGSRVTLGANRRLSPESFPIRVGTDRRLRSTYFSSRTSMAADATSFYDAYTETVGGRPEARLVRWGVLAGHDAPPSTASVPRAPAPAAFEGYAPTNRSLPMATNAFAATVERPLFRIVPKPTHGAQFQGDAGMCGEMICSGTQVCCVLPVSTDGGTPRPKPNNRCDYDCTAVCLDECPAEVASLNARGTGPHGGGLASLLP